MNERKCSGQIPAFGNWDYVNQLPITQYFQSARQAGLVRYSSSSSELDERNDAVGYKKPPVHPVVVPSQKTKENSKDWPHVKGRKKQVGNAQFPEHNKSSGSILTSVKPVDEDLYKIPSELLDTSKRMKVLRFFSRCLVPTSKV